MFVAEIRRELQQLHTVAKFVPCHGRPYEQVPHQPAGGMPRSLEG